MPTIIIKIMEPQVIAAIISGSIGAFAGISRALGNFNKKIDRVIQRPVRHTKLGIRVTDYKDEET
mgnify:CR=1 FL=1